MSCYWNAAGQRFALPDRPLEEPAAAPPRRIPAGVRRYMGRRPMYMCPVCGANLDPGEKCDCGGKLYG